MQLLSFLVFGCLLSANVFCTEVHRCDTVEINNLFKDFVKILQRDNSTCFFSVLREKHDVCQCAHDQLNKIYNEMRDCKTDFLPEDKRTFLMLQTALKGIMKNFTQEPTQKSCTYKIIAESNAESGLNKFFNQLLRKHCIKRAKRASENMKRAK